MPEKISKKQTTVYHKFKTKGFCRQTQTPNKFEILSVEVPGQQGPILQKYHAFFSFCKAVRQDISVLKI